jgi:hypothetical protein
MVPALRRHGGRHRRRLPVYSPPGGATRSHGREQSAYVGCWVFHMGDGLDADRFRSAWEKVSEVVMIPRPRLIAGDDAQVSTQAVIRESASWRAVSSDLETYLS